MIVKKDGAYWQCSTHPNTYPGDEKEYYIVDETTESGKALAQKIIQNCPYYTLVIQNGKLTDVSLTVKPPAPQTLEEQVKTLEAKLATIEKDVTSLKIGKA